MEKLLQKPLGGPDPALPPARLPERPSVLHCDECDRVINADHEVHYVESEHGVLLACSVTCKEDLEAGEHRAMKFAGGGQ